MAHRRGDTQKDMFYVGAYLGFVADNKLRSLSGKKPTTAQNIGTFRTQAQANSAPNGNGGSGYDVFAWYQLIFIQCMYVLKYKNLNSQATIGNGIGTGSVPSTGGTNTKGIDWGTTANYTTHMKLFGIEDFYGCYWQLIEGVYCGQDQMHIWTATENFNDNHTNFIDRGSFGPTSSLGLGWVKKVASTTRARFCATQLGGSDTTYYCDKPRMNYNTILWYGLNVSYGKNSEGGMFYLNFEHSPGSGNSTTSARLMYV